MNAPSTVAPIRTVGVDPEIGQRARDYRRMEQVLEWLAEHFDQQPQLAEAAAQAGLSEFHFQRLFTRWVGLSPKQYVQLLSLERAKSSLDQSRSVLDASFEAGLSGPGRLHDLFVGVDAVTPGEFKRRGEGVQISYGFQESPFGECLLTHTARGICGLAFTTGSGREAALTALRRGWDRAELAADDGAASAMIDRIFSAREGAPGNPAPLRVLLNGTRFQIKVWQALLRVPPGAVISYEDLARRVGHPRAVRAVGSASGANAIAYLIPCHRVIRKSGLPGGYRWGGARKLAMLTAESALTPTESRFSPQPPNRARTEPLRAARHSP